MKHYKQYINGQFIDSKATSVIEILNPCTEEVISTISSGTVEDANNALEAAQAAQPAWEALPAIQRAVFLHKMADVIRENRVFLAETLVKRTSKSYWFGTS